MYLLKIGIDEDEAAICELLLMGIDYDYNYV